MDRWIVGWSGCSVFGFNVKSKRKRKRKSDRIFSSHSPLDTGSFAQEELNLFFMLVETSWNATARAKARMINWKTMCSLVPCRSPSDTVVLVES